MTTDNFSFYLKNRLIQTSQIGGQWYSDNSPFSIPWSIRTLGRYIEIVVSTIYYDLYGKIFTKLLAIHCNFYVLGTVTTKGQIKLLVHTLDKVPTTEIMFVKSFVTC